MQTDSDDIYRNIFSLTDATKPVKIGHKPLQLNNINDHNRPPGITINNHKNTFDVPNSNLGSEIFNDYSFDITMPTMTESSYPNNESDIHDTSLYEGFDNLHNDHSGGFDFDAYSTSSSGPGPSSEQTPNYTSASSAEGKYCSELLNNGQQLPDNTPWPLLSFHQGPTNNIKIENKEGHEDKFELESKSKSSMRDNKASNSTNLEFFLSLSARVNILVRTVKEIIERSRFNIPPPILKLCIYNITTTLISHVPEYVSQNCQTTWISHIFEQSLNRYRHEPLNLDQSNDIMGAVAASGVFNVLNNEIKEGPVNPNMIYDLVENEISIQVNSFIINNDNDNNNNLNHHNIPLNANYYHDKSTCKRAFGGKETQTVINQSAGNVVSQLDMDQGCHPAQLDQKENPLIETKIEHHLSHELNILTNQGELFKRQNTGQRFYRPIMPSEIPMKRNKIRKIGRFPPRGNTTGCCSTKSNSSFTKQESKKILAWAFDFEGSDTRPTLFDKGYYRGPDFGTKGMYFNQDNHLRPWISQEQQIKWVIDPSLSKSFMDLVDSWSLPLVRINNNQFHRQETRRAGSASYDDLVKAVALVCSRPARRINKYPAVQYIYDFPSRKLNVKDSLRHDLRHLPSEAMRQTLCGQIPSNIKSLEIELRETLNYCDDYSKSKNNNHHCKGKRNILGFTDYEGNIKKRRAAVKRLRQFYELQESYQKRRQRDKDPSKKPVHPTTTSSSLSSSSVPNLEKIVYNVKYLGDSSYEPKFIRYDNALKQAWCTYCPNGGFYFTKNSGYLYHRNHDHGQLPGDGIMEEPLAIRNKPMTVPAKSSACEGLCGICFHWVDVDHISRNSIKLWGTWFRHYKNCVNEYQDAKRVIELACGEEFELVEFEFKPPYVCDEDQ